MKTVQMIGTFAGKYRYIMMSELYSNLSQDKVIKEVALRSGVSQSVIFFLYGDAKVQKEFIKLLNN